MQLPQEIEALRGALLQGLQALGWSAAGLHLPADAVDKLLSYLALLHKWNKAYNLTAVRDPKDMLSLHLLDCLATITPIEQHLGYAPKELIDVGSGGGLPGVVYAIAWPEGEQHLVDTVGKKAAFLQQCKLHLKLPNMHAHHQRIELLKLPAQSNSLIGKHDGGNASQNASKSATPNASTNTSKTATPSAAASDSEAQKTTPRIFTCRAFASLHDFVSQTWHLRESGSQWIALKGQWPEAEIAELNEKTARELNTSFKLHRIQIHPPGLEDTQRHLICLESLGTDS